MKKVLTAVRQDVNALESPVIVPGLEFKCNYAEYIVCVPLCDLFLRV